MGLFDWAKESTVKGRTAKVKTVRRNRPRSGSCSTATSRAPDDDYGRPTDVQRPLHKGHCEETKRYYRDVDQLGHPRLRSSPATPAAWTSGTGNCQGFTSEFQVLDGQHRIQARPSLERGTGTPAVTPESQRKLENLLESHVALQYVDRPRSFLL